MKFTKNILWVLINTGLWERLVDKGNAASLEERYWKLTDEAVAAAVEEQLTDDWDEGFALSKRILKELAAKEGLPEKPHPVY